MCSQPRPHSRIMTCASRRYLPGWTRAHVLTHLARNADGGTRLLEWARTGVKTPEYPSVEARAEEIEEGANRSSIELLADVRDSARRFATEYALMPAEAWQSTVRWTGGHHGPALEAADARLCEVLIHHVDLNAGFSPADWPKAFTTRMLSDMVAHFSTRAEAPAARLYSRDTATWYELHHASSSVQISGTESALLAWLLGRSNGDDLSTPLNITLPDVPPL